MCCQLSCLQMRRRVHWLECCSNISLNWEKKTQNYYIHEHVRLLLLVASSRVFFQYAVFPFHTWTTIDFSALAKISFTLWYERASIYRVKDKTPLNTSHVYFTRSLEEVSLAPSCFSFIFQIIYGFSWNSFDQMCCVAKWIFWSVLRERSPNSCPHYCEAPSASDGCMQAPSWKSPQEETSQVLALFLGFIFIPPNS